MEYSKHTNLAIVEDPFKVRPGTQCTVEITYTVKSSVVWDSSTIFSDTFPGLVVANSVKCDEDIPEGNILVTENDGNYTVVIYPINEGSVTLDVYYYNKSTINVVGRSAFNQSDQTYYKDFVLKEGLVYPMTVLEIGTIAGSYSINAIKVTPQVTNNGIDRWNGYNFNLDSQGLLEYNGEYVNILRNGKQQEELPADFDGPFKQQLVDNIKLVEYDNQEWRDGFSEARGILVYDEQVLVTTNRSLCVLDIYDNFSDFVLEDTFIIGYDLTYYSDDTIGVAVGDKIEKYRIRHDFTLVDDENKRVYFRESNPEFTVTEG